MIVCIGTSEATLASYKNGDHQSSDANNDNAVVPNNGNGHGKARHATVCRSTSDENNA